MTNPQGAAPQPAPNNQAAAARQHLGQSFDRLKKAVTGFSGHAEKAKASAKLKNVVKSPEFRSMEKRLIKDLKNTNLGPRGAQAGPGAMSPELAHRMMVAEANGQELFTRSTNEMDIEFTEFKGEVMSRLGSDAELGRDWLEVLVDLDAAGLRMAAFVEGQAAKYEWMQSLTGGQLIQSDAVAMRQVSDAVIKALGGKIFDLKDKAFQEGRFAYNRDLGEAANQALMDQARAKLVEIEQLTLVLKPHYRRYGEIINAVGEHVSSLIDEEGWKAYAATHLKHGKVDYAIDGVDFVLSGLASTVREIPYPGVGAASGLIILGIGKVTGMLHKLARDARITEAKKAVAPGGVMNEKALRRVYLDAMNADKAMMATRVLQIQKENMDSLWGVVGVALAEIPVPLVGAAIKTFCLGITNGYYQARVDKLKEELAPIQPGMAEQAKETVKKLFVEPGVDTVKDVVKNQFKTQCAELGLEVWKAAGKSADAIVEFFRSRFGEAGDIAKDALKEGLITMAANVAAALCAELIAKIATTAIAQEVSGGDLRLILDRMQNTKQDVDMALATMT